MRLVFIITGLGVGGAETMLLKLLERLDRQRFSPHVISLTTLGVVGPRVAALGIPVEAMHLRAGRPDPRAVVTLTRRIRALRADAVHTWMYHADLLGGLAARLAGVSALAWCVRHSNIARAHNKRSTWIVARSCALASRWIPRRIVFCSDAARRNHAAIGYADKKAQVLPNGFDLVRFRPDMASRAELRLELGLPADAPLVGLIGRTDPQKNHAGFVEAMGMLHRQRPQAHFVLAGEGATQENLQLAQWISQAGLQRACHLLGYRGDMPHIMAGLDVLVSSSLGESFSNVLGEAMACGVPCAVTDVGDSAYIVGDTGRVVAPADAPALADATQSLLDLSLAQRMAQGNAARERVNQLFEIGEVVRHYERFYEGLLGGATGPTPLEGET